MNRAAILFAMPVSLLVACDRGTPPDTKSVPAPVAESLPTMPCALGGGTAFAESCTIERIASDRGWTLVVHHPDGGFRRLSVTTDGRGVVAADGAQPASVTVVDPRTIEVAIGGDRYRLPATIKGQAPADR